MYRFIKRVEKTALFDGFLFRFQMCDESENEGGENEGRKDREKGNRVEG